MTRYLLAVIATLLTLSANAALVFRRPVDGTGTLIPSSWVFPEGSDSDIYAYDTFIVGATVDITDIYWEGGYIYGARWGKANNFSVTFYETNITGFEPHVDMPDTQEPRALAQYEVGDNAGEAPAASGLYGYHFTLPQPFHAVAGEKYWLRIEAYQPAIPDWAIARASGGDGWHFRYMTGYHMFQKPPGDTAFTLTTTLGPAYAISTDVSPAGAGTVKGAETYAPGATVTLTAKASGAVPFARWEENGVTVGTTATLTFTASADRALTAVFESPTRSTQWVLR